MRPTDQNPDFRDRLTAREIPLVLATCNDDLLTSPDGHRRATKVLATIAGADENEQAGANWERRSIGPYAPEARRRQSETQPPPRTSAASVQPGRRRQLSSNLAGRMWPSSNCELANVAPK